MHESVVPHTAYGGAKMQKNANQHQWSHQWIVYMFVACFQFAQSNVGVISFS